MKKEGQRNINYDIIRVIAIILVILCHSIEIIYFSKVSNLSLKSNLFYFISHSISRLGVPFFLFLSGALLLSKDFEKEENIKKFYKYNLLNLIIVCEIWYICYYLLDIYVFNKTFYLKDFIPVLFFLKQYPLAHAWYLPMIIGIYITIPLVSIIIKKHEKLVKYIMIINIFYIFIIPMINIVLNLLRINYQIPSTFNIFFGGEVYGVYLLLGYFISKNYNNKKYNKKFLNYLLIVISFLSLAVTVLIRYKLNCDSWYNMFTILVCSSCLYILLLKIKTNHLKNIVKKLSICSFGVYLIHKPIIDLMNKYNFINETNYILPFKVLLYFSLTFIVSYLIVIFLSKIKYIKKYLFFIK